LAYHAVDLCQRCDRTCGGTVGDSKTGAEHVIAGS